MCVSVCLSICLSVVCVCVVLLCFWYWSFYIVLEVMILLPPTSWVLESLGNVQPSSFQKLNMIHSISKQILFIHSPIDGHLGSLYLLAVGTRVTDFCSPLFYIPLVTDKGVERLNHMVILCLTLRNHHAVFHSQFSYHLTFPPIMCEGSQFSTAHSTCRLDSNHANGDMTCN